MGAAPQAAGASGGKLRAPATHSFAVRSTVRGPDRKRGHFPALQPSSSHSKGSQTPQPSLLATLIHSQHLTCARFVAPTLRRPRPALVPTCARLGQAGPNDRSLQCHAPPTACHCSGIVWGGVGTHSMQVRPPAIAANAQKHATAHPIDHLHSDGSHAVRIDWGHRDRSLQCHAPPTACHCSGIV